MNCSLKHFAGVENAMRLKSCLDATHQLEPEAVDDAEASTGQAQVLWSDGVGFGQRPFLL